MLWLMCGSLFIFTKHGTLGNVLGTLQMAIEALGIFQTAGSINRDKSHVESITQITK